MKFALQVCAWGIGIPLDVLVIAAMLRGAYRQFPLLFAYSLFTLFVTVAELPPYLAYYENHQNKSAAAWLGKWYWSDELISQVLLYTIVITFVYLASRERSGRVGIRGGIIAGALLFAGISYLIHAPGSTTDELMTLWTRDLSFCAAILDLALWTLLLSWKGKDHRLLLLSGALGIQFTGEAIGEAIINLSTSYKQSNLPLAHGIALGGSVLTVAANMTCLYLWWQAFRAHEPVNSKPVLAG